MRERIEGMGEGEGGGACGMVEERKEREREKPIDRGMRPAQFLTGQRAGTLFPGRGLMASPSTDGRRNILPALLLPSSDIHILFYSRRCPLHAPPLLLCLLRRGAAGRSEYPGRQKAATLRRDQAHRSRSRVDPGRCACPSCVQCRPSVFPDARETLGAHPTRTRLGAGVP
jgi:hypothetical protein